MEPAKEEVKFIIEVITSQEQKDKYQKEIFELQEVFESYLNPDKRKKALFEHLQSSLHEFWILRENTLQACLMLQFTEEDENFVTVLDLCRNQDEKYKGLGAKLMERVLKYLKEECKRKIKTVSLTALNQKLVTYYEKFGFQVVGSLVMELNF